MKEKEDNVFIYSLIPHKGKINKNRTNLNWGRRWTDKILIKFVVSLLILLSIIGVKIINTEPTNLILNRIEYRLSQKFYIKKNYLWLKNVLGNCMERGEGLITAMTVGTQEDRQYIPPMEGEIICEFNQVNEKDGRLSKGIIIKGVRGEKILAIQNGVVLDVGHNPYDGCYIIIKHTGELLSVYKNINASLVVENQGVSMGDIIGDNFDKLEFEIWDQKQAVDPMTLINWDINNL